MDKTQKTEAVDQIKGEWQNVQSIILAEYRGIDVPSVTAIRDEFRKVGCQYKVLKNTLVRIAIQGTPIEPLSAKLVGPTAVIWSTESASAPAERNDLHRQLFEALGTLPPDQRAALVLVDMQGYPVAEAARVLDVPTGTVKSRCARGRARLQPLLTHLRPENTGAEKEGDAGRNRAQRTSVPPAAEPRTEGPDSAGTGDSAAVKGGGGRA